MLPVTDGEDLEQAGLLGAVRCKEVLERGHLDVSGRFVLGSNATLLATAKLEGEAVHVVYKPRRGERPLWDFPDGALCRREVAAWEVDRALGWRLVPPTVLRDGPFGEGMVQLYIPHDPEVHFLAMEEPDPLFVARLEALDIVINNADRKSGHVLRSEDGRLWAIDHGVSFHAEPKRRTVVWTNAGCLLPESVAADLERLSDRLRDRESPLTQRLGGLISVAELAALRMRAERLLDDGIFQLQPDMREFPWPPV